MPLPMQTAKESIASPTAIMIIESKSTYILKEVQSYHFSRNYSRYFLKTTPER